MDGRQYLRFGLYSGLILVGSTGCNRNNTYPGSFGFPKPGQTTMGAVTPPDGGRTWWGGKTAAPKPPAELSSSTTAEMPARPRKPGEGFLPETEVAIADTRVAVALADPPPPNRDQLLDQARQGYAKALQKDPKNKAALLSTAKLYTRMGERDRVRLETYRTYLKTYPTDHEIMFQAAMTCALGRRTGTGLWRGASRPSTRHRPGKPLVPEDDGVLPAAGWAMG